MNRKKKYRKRPLENHNIKRFEYLSAYLRETRYMTGLSRKALAEKTNLNRSLFDRGETNKNLTLKTVFELCDVYEITPDELFQGVE